MIFQLYICWSIWGQGRGKAKWPYTAIFIFIFSQGSWSLQSSWKLHTILIYSLECMEQDLLIFSFCQTGLSSLNCKPPVYSYALSIMHSHNGSVLPFHTTQAVITHLLWPSTIALVPQIRNAESDTDTWISVSSHAHSSHTTQTRVNLTPTKIQVFPRELASSWVSRHLNCQARWEVLWCHFF